MTNAPGSSTGEDAPVSRPPAGVQYYLHNTEHSHELVLKLKRYARAEWKKTLCTAYLMGRDGKLITQKAWPSKGERLWMVERRARMYVAMKWLDQAKQQQWSTTPSMLKQARPRAEQLS